MGSARRSKWKLEAETRPDKKYYEELAEACSEKASKSCCMSSVRRMETGGFSLSGDGPAEEACAETMSVNMLKCKSSYRWCVPKSP